MILIKIGKIGGSTSWKLGPAAASLAAQARRLGKWVHMGRVNSLKRLRYAASIGCDSADGTYLAFGPERNLSRLLGLAVRRQRRPEAAERSGQVGRDARLFSQQLSLREREFDVISNSEPTIPNVPTSSKQSTTESPTAAWTADRIRALGTVTTVPIAAEIFGLSRSVAYELIHADGFPVPVLRFGSRYRVPVRAILAALHMPADPEPPGST
jgi:hypothetical protein